VALGVAVLPAYAHHPPAAEFDETQTIELRGTVVKAEWVNPHTWIHVDVAEPNGTLTRWMLEGASATAMNRAGITKDSLAVGMEFTARVHPAKDKANRAEPMTIVLKGRTYNIPSWSQFSPINLNAKP
jgi:hypothetical protein